jgi:hypothetical protein
MCNHKVCSFEHIGTAVKGETKSPIDWCPECRNTQNGPLLWLLKRWGKQGFDVRFCLTPAQLEKLQPILSDFKDSKFTVQVSVPMPIQEALEAVAVLSQLGKPALIG